MIANTITSFSQVISTEEINRHIVKDSATFSWEQANQFVNGLENERKLDSAFHRSKRENVTLLNSYNSLNKRFINYQDTIVPAYEQIILDNNANHSDLTILYEDTEKLLGKQRFIKWIYAIVGVALGTVLGIIISI